MKKHNYTKAELLNRRRNDDDLIRSANTAHLICTIAILIDCYEFTPEQIDDFMDRYREFLISFNKGDEEYIALRKNINEYMGYDFIK